MDNAMVMALTGQDNTSTQAGERSAGGVPLTWELMLYIVIGLVGLAARLAALARWPLMESEAGVALAAWRAHQGVLARPASYSPLVFDVNLVLFALTRATDGAVRLLPALAGSLLVVLPYKARHLLGRQAALISAALLALSPTMLFYSRAAEGTILAAMLGVLTVITFGRYIVGRRPKDLYVAAVALGLALTTAPGIYTTITGVVLAGFIVVRMGRRELLDQGNHSGWLVGVDLRKVALLFAGAFLLSATAISANPHGLAASVSLAGRWFTGLAVNDGAWPILALPRNLALYEFAILALGLVGVIWGLVRKNSLDRFLTVWCLWALLLGLLPGHRDGAALVSLLLPLTALAGRGAERLMGALRRDLSWVDAASAAVGTIIVIFSSLELASYLHTGQEQYLSYAQISLGVFLIAFAAYWFWSQRDAAARLLVAVIGFFVLVLSLQSSVALNYRTARDPREPLLMRPVSTQLRDATAFIKQTSSRQAGDPYAVELFYESSLDPWFGWYLRDFQNAQAVDSIRERYDALVLVDKPRDGEPVPSGFAGQRFRLTESWPDQDLSARQKLQWFVYRDPVGFEKAQELRILVALGAR